MYPYPNPSILGKGLNLFKSIKWGTILDGTQKTLGVINQAIPVIYQVKPLVSNAKSLFKIVGAINNTDNKNTTTTNNTETDTKSETITNKPVFYL